MNNILSRTVICLACVLKSVRCIWQDPEKSMKHKTPCSRKSSMFTIWTWVRTWIMD